MTTNLVTLAELAQKLGMKESRARYLVLSRGVRPAKRAGNCRLFGPEAIEILRAAMAARSATSPT